MFRHVGGCERNIGQLFIRVVPKLLANLHKVCIAKLAMSLCKTGLSGIVLIYRQPLEYENLPKEKFLSTENILF